MSIEARPEGSDGEAASGGPAGRIGTSGSLRRYALKIVPGDDSSHCSTLQAPPASFPIPPVNPEEERAPSNTISTSCHAFSVNARRSSTISPGPIPPDLQPAKDDETYEDPNASFSKTRRSRRIPVG